MKTGSTATAEWERGHAREHVKRRTAVHSQRVLQDAPALAGRADPYS